VSKKIAQKLGGDLVLDTSYTDGSRFVLTLPATNY
jgi:signal transduction histidine kinase